MSRVVVEQGASREDALEEAKKVPMISIPWMLGMHLHRVNINSCCYLAGAAAV